MPPPNHTICMGLTPCPNDTYLAYAWLHRRFQTSLQLQPAFADIETLNTLALRGEFPITKISAALLDQLPHYRLMSCGAALRRGAGPKLIAKVPFPLSSLATKSVAFPGQLTAATALYRRLLPKPREEQFMRCDKLFGHLRRRGADAAVIIHEGRFCFSEKGFVEIADLGDLWESHSGLPVPLGVFVAREDVSPELEEQCTEHFRRSMEFAREHSGPATAFATTWAFETSAHLCARHIELYVTDETHTLSDEGRRAIAALLKTE